MNKKKKKSLNPISRFLFVMGLIVIFLTVWVVFTASEFSELYWLLFAIGISLGITEIAVAWLIDIQLEK